MAKRQDDLDMPQRDSERGHEEDPRGSGVEDIRGIARDEEDDEFEDDDLDEGDEDDSEDL